MYLHACVFIAIDVVFSAGTTPVTVHVYTDAIVLVDLIALNSRVCVYHYPHTVS